MNNKNTEFVADSRFRSMGKEAILVTVYWLIMFAGIMLSAYFFGKGDPTQYTYLFGFPVWFSLSMLIMIAGIIVGIFMVLKVFKDVPLDAEDPEYDYQKGEKRS